MCWLLRVRTQNEKISAVRILWHLCQIACPQNNRLTVEIKITDQKKRMAKKTVYLKNKLMNKHKITFIQ